MHPFNDPTVIPREATDFPGSLLPSQLTSLMLLETEDLLSLIAPIVLPIIGSVMAPRYPTQHLKVAANTPIFTIVQLVSSGNSRRAHTYQSIVRNFANLRPPMAYTVIKGRKQVEHNYSTVIRARARCALSMPLEHHPVWWLHIPLDPETGAVDNFPEWGVTAIL